MKLPISRVVLVAGLLLIAVSVLIVTRLFADNTSPVETANVIVIKADDMRFNLDTITLKVGQPVTIQLENNDEMDHAFAIEALNVWSDPIGPREVTSVTFTPQEVGTFRFNCPVMEHAKLGMVGTVEVVN